MQTPTVAYIKAQNTLELINGTLNSALTNFTNEINACHKKMNELNVENESLRLRIKGYEQREKENEKEQQD